MEASELVESSIGLQYIGNDASILFRCREMANRGVDDADCLKAIKMRVKRKRVGS
jgi:hypothetical protein